MKLLFKIFLYVAAGLAFCILCLYLWVLYEAKDRYSGPKTWVSIKSPPKGIRDLCVVENDVYILCWGSGNVFRLENDTVVPVFGEYGVGELKFRSPARITHYGNQLVISDSKNLDVQVVDSSGRFIGRFPKRKQDDFHWMSKNIPEGSLGDLFVSDQFFGLVVVEPEIGEKVHLFENNSSEMRQIGDAYASISSIDYDSINQTIFIATDLEKTLLAYGTDGRHKYSIGAWGERPFSFAKIQDLSYAGTRLYVLNVQYGPRSDQTGTGSILIFNDSLEFVDSITLDKSFYLPRAMDLMDDGKTLLIGNGHGTGLLYLDISQTNSDRDSVKVTTR